MFCSSCGASVADGTKFCPSCGSILAPQRPLAQVPAVGPSAAPPAAAAPAYTASPTYPAGPIALSGDYATWSTRAIGYLIDALLVAPAMLILYFLLSGVISAVAGLGSNAAGGLCCFFIVLFPLASLAVGLFNRVYLIARRGASIGQGVVKIKVVDANGGLLSQGTALIRLLAQVAMGLVPFLPLLDLLWPLWDDRRQTLHDKAVGCFVVNNPQIA